jgi:hypothetical protein
MTTRHKYEKPDTIDDLRKAIVDAIREATAGAFDVRVKDVYYDSDAASMSFDIRIDDSEAKKDMEEACTEVGVTPGKMTRGGMYVAGYYRGRRKPFVIRKPDGEQFFATKNFVVKHFGGGDEAQ